MFLALFFEQIKQTIKQTYEKIFLKSGVFRGILNKKICGFPFRSFLKR